jgi:DNA-binding transcriptional LysR family regulator
VSSLLNQSAGLVAFVRVVEAGSFSAAARNTGTTPSAISKAIRRLEAELGVQLFRRSTRTLGLTPDGQAFFDRVASPVRDIEDSADAIRSGGGVHGRLRVSMPSELGRLLMGPITKTFMALHPQLELDLALSDRHVDVIGEGYDVVFRVGTTVESELKMRTLARLEMSLVAAPALLQKTGEPRSIKELRELPFVRYLLAGRTLPLTFADGSTITPRGRIGLDTGFGLRAAALNGMGVTHLMTCTVQADLDRGDLVGLMRSQRLASLPLMALHAFGKHTPSKVKLITDFIAQEVRRLTAA